MRGTPEQPDARPLLSGMGWVGLSLLAGALAAPWLFNGLLNLGRSVESLSVLRELEFVSVFSRCTLVLLLLFAWLMARRRGLRWQELDFLQGRGRGRDFRNGLLFGLLSLGLLGGLGLLLGAYELRADARLGRLATMLLGALLIGFIEEALFRGLLFSAFRKLCGFWPAALAGSAIFAVVHFVQPEPPGGLVHVHALSGLELFRHAFPFDGPLHRYWPYGLMLFVMGLLLCRIYEQRGNLYLVAGLHAGWVMVMQAIAQLFQRVEGVQEMLFGSGSLVARSWAATGLGLLLLAGACLYFSGEREA